MPPSLATAAPLATLAKPPAIAPGPAPIEQRYCRQCETYKAAKCFGKRRNSLCQTCLQHNRERAESKQLDPQQDERIAALRSELGPAQHVEIQLPGVEAWVQQYIAAYGGVEAAMNHILKQLAWLEKYRPGHRTIFDVHMGFLKMHMAVSAAQDQRAHAEPQMSLAEAFRTFNLIAEKYQPAIKALGPPPEGEIDADEPAPPESGGGA